MSKNVLARLAMKILSFLLIVSIFIGCTPEQEGTEFNKTVSPVIGQNVETSTLEDEPIKIIYSVDENEESIDLTFDMVETPKYGKLEDCKFLNKREWECIYIPGPNFNGDDKVGFKTRDGDFSSKEKSYIKISVIPVDDPASAGDSQEFTLMENKKITFLVNEGKDPDSPASNLTYEILDEPKNGKLVNCFNSSNKRECTYIPTAQYYGEDKFSYKVYDDSGKVSEKDSAEVQFHVLKEWVKVDGTSVVKVEEKESNVLIVFALDTSGSMREYINHMHKTVLQFIEEVTKRGFKATVAFVSSDQIQNITWKNVTKNLSPHPSYPKALGTYLNTTEIVPVDSAIKIFEIDAYDFAWNMQTKNLIEKTKQDISTFLSELKEGSDDERLLCSTIRLLYSKYAEDKDYVGVFSLANEEDAGDAGSVEQAFKDCVKDSTKERLPKASCLTNVACNVGEIGCNPKWIYEYTETSYPNPIYDKFVGQCEKYNDVLVDEYKTFRRAHRMVDDYTESTVRVCTGTKSVNYRQGTKTTPLTDKVVTRVCEDAKKVYEDYRKGEKKVARYQGGYEEQCKAEWETLDNPSGCKNIYNSKKTLLGYDHVPFDQKGLCSALSSSIEFYTPCEDYKKLTNDGCYDNVSYVLNGEYKVENINQVGRCSDLSSSILTLFNGTCQDYQVDVETGCSNKVVKTYTGSQSREDHAAFGSCEDLLALDEGWQECSESQEKTGQKVASGEKTKTLENCSVQKSSVKSCSDWKSERGSLVTETCSKVSSGSLGSAVSKQKKIERPISHKETCLEVTGQAECDSITWDGTKQITTDDYNVCGLASEMRETHYFSVDGVEKQSLAQSVADRLKKGFTKSVYLSVIHDEQKNADAAIKVNTNPSLEFPSIACSRYQDRIDKFGAERINGTQFKKVSELLGEQGEVYSICSPEKYPSNKLDYLVANAQLSFNVKENDLYDKLQILGVKIIYASGEEKVLKENQFSYKDGKVVLLSEELAKNLVEIHMSYTAYEK